MRVSTINHEWKGYDVFFKKDEMRKANLQIGKSGD